MTRRALIIAAPGSTNNSLPGVEFDLQNYCNFLLSPSGGGWQPDEIKCLLNPHRSEVMRHVQQMQADYTLIVFSGHGAMDKTTGWSFIEVNSNGEQIWVNKLDTKAGQQLVILDSCRDYVSTLAGIVAEGQQTFPSSLAVSEARELFDTELAQCEKGLIVCYACEPGTSAADTLGGGLFSNVLFQVAQDWVSTPSPDSILSIYDTLQNAHHILTMSSKQSPALRLVPTNRHHWFPFAVRQAMQVV